MNRAYSVQDYRSTVFAMPMTQGKRRLGTDSFDASDVVALPASRFGTLGLPVRGVNGVAAGVSSAFPTTISVISKQSVSSRTITGEGRKRNIREEHTEMVPTLMPGQMKLKTKEQQDKGGIPMSELYDLLEKALPNSFLNDNSRNPVQQKLEELDGPRKVEGTKRPNVVRKQLIAGAIDYLNALGIEIIRLTEHRDVSGSVQKYSKLEVITESGLPKLKCKDKQKERKDKEVLRYQVVTSAISVLKETLTGLGINASNGLTNDELKEMKIDWAAGDWSQFLKPFSMKTTLLVAAAMIKALETQLNGVRSGVSDVS